MQDHEDSQQLHKCRDCGAVYDDHTLPHVWRNEKQVVFCRACNSVPPDVQPTE
ncbi:MAG: hypothetical protein GY938_30740 [Ketobacter sp.]|nr:hypothetical protein [Ketobacter sp.]